MACSKTLASETPPEQRNTPGTPPEQRNTPGTTV